ncbi:cytochrome c maturation protein CcmE [Halovulum dunhuangense]|uniref:Cytochrome c-type biogenesis protein CcmE n=1 Tax=Halovulum dunhuangense TaxID=1505036 RepID=A0A849L2S8_9RHOB|nr:cytochrome c maturation protein CcmE [Halovulum dunhuangense]NNU80563.1 cytochrome c maturation protein CcmE [Halovulum dunhuangense]
MAGLKKKRRIQLLMAGAGLLVAATGLVIYAGRDAFEFFRSPSQLATDPPRVGERFRLGGLVKEGSWVRNGETHLFVVTDMTSDFPVSYTGIVPDLFREGQGTVVTGTIEDGVFRATEVLARHDEQYMPKEVIDALKEQGVYEEPEPAS